MRYKKIKILVIIIIILLQLIIPVISEINFTAISVAAEETNTEYNNLKSQLSSVLEGKSFTSEVKNLLLDTLEMAYDNYSEMKEVFAIMEYPSVTEFLTDNFINLIRDNIDTIVIYNEDDPQGVAMFDKIGVSGARAVYFKEEKAFYLLESEHSDECMLTLHEIFHSSQQAILSNYSDISLYYMFVEGGAVSNANLLRSNKLSGMGAVQIMDSSKSDYFFNISSDGSMTQSLDGNMFQKLQIIVGYDAMQQYKKDGDISKIKNIIDIKCGTNKGDELLNNIRKIYEYEYPHWFAMPGTEEDAFNAIINIENIMLAYIKSEMSSINSRDKAIKWLNSYRGYKGKYLITYVEEKIIDLGEDGLEDRITDYTSQKFDTTEIEDILIDKIIQYNALPKFSNNTTLNQMAIKSILLDFDNNNSKINAPYNIYRTVYLYGENNQDGELLLYDIKNNNCYFNKYEFSTSLSAQVQALSTSYDFTGFQPLIVLPVLDTNNNLSEITINNGTLSPTFNKDITNYTVTVPNNITSITVGGTKETTKSSFVTNYEPRTVNLNVGNNTIDIKVKAEDGTIKTYTITVVAKELDEILIETAPIKTEYIEGQSFDKTGMKVTAIYNDETTKDVTDCIETDGTNLTVGKTEVTISYEEEGITKTATQEITVVAKALTGISVTTAPEKTEYIEGQSFDKTGMKVTATYNDGSEKEVTNYTVTDGTNLTTGKTSVTISYTENGVIKTATQKITVINKVEVKTLTGISVTTVPTKTSYTAGQDFDKTGMKVTATYSDGTTKEITNYTITDGTNLAIGKTSVTISYIENGVTKTTTQCISIVGEETKVSIELKADSAYEISEGYIINIQPKTTVEEFINNLTVTPEGTTVKVYKEANEVQKDDIIKTGEKIEVTKGEKKVEYVLVVIGDVNGTGTVNVSDITTIMMHMVEGIAIKQDTTKVLAGAYLKAANMNKDTKVNITDLTLLMKMVAENR